MYIQYDIITGMILATVTGAKSAPPVAEGRAQIEMPDNVSIEGMMIDVSQNPPTLIAAPIYKPTLAELQLQLKQIQYQIDELTQ